MPGARADERSTLCNTAVPALEGALTLTPLSGIGEILPGCDVAAVLAEALDRLAPSRRSGVLAVTSKIVSKAEGRFAILGDVAPGAEALRIAAITGKDPLLVAIVLAESVSVVRAAPRVLITRHRSGHVMANAGVDQSNLGPGAIDRVLLLPQDCDGSARALRDVLRVRGYAVDVLICDSFGRPWRNGVVNVALGAAGLPAIIDRRGACDRDGRTLEVTQIGFADMIAGAAGLVMGEDAEGVPAVIVGGLHWDAPDAPAASLLRPEAEDLFR